MQRPLKTLLVFLAILAFVSLPRASTAASEKRLALVIGNASYKAKALATPANDAALIAQTLQAAGFDVMGARDLDEGMLRQTFRDFVDRVGKAGPDAVVAVYFAGYGLQLEGENYLVPIDADIKEASDVPLRTVRLSEQTRALAALNLNATFVILDVARVSPFVLSGQPPAGGLAWVEPETNMLIAFNAAPGTVAPDVGNGYGPYAKALAEMIRQGGLTPANVFDRVRLRVNELTKGAQVPWDASRIETQFMFLERGPGAPLRADSPEQTVWMRSQPMRSLGAHDAYMVALTRDTFDGYADFLADYWQDPMTKRVRALVAARREAITWRRTCQANVPDAYWSYLERYPHGPHVADARRLLTRLGAAIAPPSKFARAEYDVPPPLPDELEYIERAVLAFDDPALAFEPPQPSPAYFLQPPPPELVALAPPAAASGAHILPAPMLVSLPDYVGLPADAGAPSNTSISNDLRKTLAVNNTNDLPTRQDSRTVSSSNPQPNATSPADRAQLPSSVVTTATLTNSQSTPPRAANPLARDEAGMPADRASPADSLVPFWATYDPARQDIKARPGPALLTVPLPSLRPTYHSMGWEEIKSSLSRSLPAASRPRAAGSVRLPAPRPVALAPPTDTQSPQTTDSIAVPDSSPAMVKKPPIRSRPKPIAHTSSPSEAGQTQRPLATLLNGLGPSTQAAHPPKVALGASPPKPPKKPCAVVDGDLVCN